MRDFEAIIRRMRGGVEGEDGEDEEDEGDEAGEAAEVADEVEEDEDEDDVVVDEEESARNRSTMSKSLFLLLVFFNRSSPDPNRQANTKTLFHFPHLHPPTPSHPRRSNASSSTRTTRWDPLHPPFVLPSTLR